MTASHGFNPQTMKKDSVWSYLCWSKHSYDVIFFNNLFRHFTCCVNFKHINVEYIMNWKMLRKIFWRDVANHSLCFILRDQRFLKPRNCRKHIQFFIEQVKTSKLQSQHNSCYGSPSHVTQLSPVICQCCWDGKVNQRRIGVFFDIRLCFLPAGSRMQDTDAEAANQKPHQ